MVSTPRIPIDRARLLDTAMRLVAVPSPTGAAGGVLDALAELLASDGFRVERIDAGHPDAPAVAVRLDSGRPGLTLQFNGHLDTVHLPFVPPEVVDGRLLGSGSCDMKGGMAAAIEALRALRDAEALPNGSILLTAHDLHEAPWGDGRQLDAMIAAGVVGDAVLLPEPLSDHLPTIGRGQSCWKATIRRKGPPIHEVMRPFDEPNVIAVAAELVSRLMRLDVSLATEGQTAAGRSSAFVGQIHGGDIYNGFAQDCWLEGTRRWLPGNDRHAVELAFRALIEDLAHETGATIDLAYQLVRDAFALDESSRLVRAFQSSYTAISGHPLAIGPKPFVDDGNTFHALAGIPAITHGPRAGGQHTVDEWVDIDDLVRVAQLYATTSIAFLSS